MDEPKYKTVTAICEYCEKTSPIRLKNDGSNVNDNLHWFKCPHCGRYELRQA